MLKDLLLRLHVQDGLPLCGLDGLLQLSKPLLLGEGGSPLVLCPLLPELKYCDTLRLASELGHLEVGPVDRPPALLVPHTHLAAPGEHQLSQCCFLCMNGCNILQRLPLLLVGTALVERRGDALALFAPHRRLTCNDEQVLTNPVQLLLISWLVFTKLRHLVMKNSELCLPTDATLPRMV